LLHASHRFFEILKKHDIYAPVRLHFKTNLEDPYKLVLQMGTNIGSFLTDGNGNRVLFEPIRSYSSRCKKCPRDGI